MTDADAQWSAARPLVWGALTIALLVAGLGSWSVLATLSGAIIAPGQIEVSQRRQVVQHPDGGVVQEILVAEGAGIAKGDVLLRLEGGAIRSELAIVDNQLFELAARRARLQAQRDEAAVISFPAGLMAAAAKREAVAEMVTGQQSLFARQADALRQAIQQRRTRIAQIRNQIAGIDAQQAAINAQIVLVDADLATQRDLLEKGLAQAARVLALRRDLAQLRGVVGALMSSRSEAAGRITEIDIEISALISQGRETAETELREVAAGQLELAERAQVLAERISRLDVRAPVSGLVLGLLVTTPQSVIRPADPLMFIVPQDRPLLVAVRVPATQVDDVRPGQQVRVLFASISARTTPEVTGRITLVSADALADEGTGLAYFRTEIAFDDKSLRDVGGVNVVPGMPVEAFIRTGDRSPLSYLIKPFADYFRAAFRET